MRTIYKQTLIILGITIIYVIANIALCKYSDYAFAKEVESSLVPIEVVFVGAPKDFKILPYSVKSVKKYLKQPITKLVLVAPKSEESIKLAHSLGMQYVDEDSLLNRKEFIDWVQKNKLLQNYQNNNWNWYYQQFLKLLYYKISEANNYFIIDTDVVMERPFVLVSNDNVKTFYIGPNKLGHETAKTSIKLLLGEDQFVPEFSFIADLMCFNKNIVKSMLDKIETKFATEFYKAGILVEQKSDARFSEYEMYGVYANYSSDITPKLLTNLIPMQNSSRNRDTLFLDRYLFELKAYRYISYHAWLSGE